MEPVFKKVCSEGIDRFISEVAPFLKRLPGSALPSEYAGDLVYYGKLKSGWNVALCFQFVDNRNYVLLRLYASTQAEIPRIAECHVERRANPGHGVEDILQHLNAYQNFEVTTADFCDPPYEVQFDIKETPPRERMREAMAMPEAQEFLEDLLEDLDSDDWEGDDAVDNWPMLEEFGGGLTESDARYATDELISEINGFTRKHFLPFIEAMKSA